MKKQPKKANGKAVEIRSIADLVPDSRNANRGTERGSGLIEDSLRRFGAGRSVLADKHGRLIAGNKTVEGCVNAGMERVRVVQTDGNELVVVQRTDLDLDKDKAARELAIVDNRAAQVSLEWDAEQLESLAKDYDIDLKSLAFTPQEIERLGGSEVPEAVEDEVPDPSQVPSRCKSGDLWLLGDHRLLCGDSTKPEDVERLMGIERAALMNTDPPYGVKLDLTANHDASNAAKGIKKEYRKFEAIENDELTGEQLQKFLEDCIRAAVPHLTPNAAFYLWHPMLTQGTFFAAAADILIHRQIIWVKPHFIFGRGDYHWRHELAFYGWVKGNRPPFYGERNQDTVWMLDEGGGSIRKDQGHPTQKPVELFARPMTNHTRAGEIVYEPFAGSGSQFVAAEQLGRKCFGLEISPAYCDVIIARWEKLTGKKAAQA